jgi:hypothetical protein
MSQVLPPAPIESDISRGKAGGWPWLANWIEALVLFVGGAFVASVVGLTDATLANTWQVGAVAAGAMTLGFGAAYLFHQFRQNSQAAVTEGEFNTISDRIDILAAEHAELEHKVRRKLAVDAAEK